MENIPNNDRKKKRFILNIVNLAALGLLKELLLKF